MSEVASLQLTPREERGKGPCSRMRSNGLVPGVFYNSKGENISFSVDNLALGKAFEKVRYSKMIELQIEVDGQVQKRNALFKKLVKHPVKRRYDHVDFIGIELDKEVQVTIPVETVGRAKGVVLGGKLEILQERVMVRCLPTAIPDSVVINVTELEIGGKVLVDQLVLPEGVKAVYERNFPVVAIQTARGAKAGEEEE
ncbi:large subunit ribosomal protein L25 [Desulfomicrobium macestii]|uniref:Large ribosomal subunit protein bL25 n=2 Tax=Desulfomicrobium TaxID=898 RepID=A0A8G2BZD0_DESNO|nr:MULTISPECIES: 50S ribosomal protein L25 [Desulfomicrobium]MBE1423550.1 large subunit ribosomal protein L25 [Desulfomicrobium macestii]SFL23671.1 LSU ribosomal protein L25P [Desulfomicrobium norvegicum]